MDAQRRIHPPGAWDVNSWLVFDRRPMIGYPANVPYHLSNEYLILTLLFKRAVIETGYS
jgi:hypothetical protein